MTVGETRATNARPAVSVVMPFDGAAVEPDAALARLAAVGAGSVELIIVDHSGREAIEQEAARSAGATLVRATVERSPHYARNAGAERAAGEWLLFVDSDCRPPPDLLARYRAETAVDRCGLIAGGVDGSQPDLVDAANLMVRREAWESLGGFFEGVRAGPDAEFCIRAQAAGWLLVRRPEAAVELAEPRRRSVSLRAAARRGAARLWIRRLHPVAVERPGLTAPLRDSFAEAFGYLLGDNRVPAAAPGAPTGRAGAGLLLVTDGFPARSETFVYNEALALRDLGRRVRVESASRPRRPERAVARELPVTYMSDDPPRAKALGLVWLLARHPLGCIRDLLARRRWRREDEEVWPLAALAPAARRLARSRESHLHAEFAAAAALHALRLARLAGLSYSVTAHAYEIFQRPRNLPEKLSEAAFAAGVCEFTVEHMRGLVSPATGRRIHKILSGVDPQRFRRRSPQPGEGLILAIGRLIEKKGFVHLLEAMPLLDESGADGSRALIAGDGPLRDSLAHRTRELGLGGRVEIRGNVWGSEAVRELLEGADLLVVPSVVAADGDRDALPVVTYEALAMELPVVASRLSGLPEVVRAPWGWLVPPGDPTALAAAISEVLGLPLDERREIGREGRAFVLEHATGAAGAATLTELIDRA